MGRLSAAVQAFLKSRFFYPLVLAGCLYPGVHLVWSSLAVLVPQWPDWFPNGLLPWQYDLGVDPAKEMLHLAGRDALGLLLITLAVTPIRRLTGWNRVQTVRRTLGVSSFFYALAHFLIYVVFNELGDIHNILQDVFTRKFIFVGMFAFTILLALAVTSTKGMMRRLGRNWTRLHRLVYVAAVAGVVHFAWGQKADIHEPLEWGAFLAALLLVRVVLAIQARRVRGMRTVTP